MSRLRAALVLVVVTGASLGLSTFIEAPAHAHPGNSQLACAAGFVNMWDCTATDPDGIRRIRIYRKNEKGQLVQEGEKVKGKGSTSVDFKVPHAVAHDHFIKITDGQKPPARDWWVIKADGSIRGPFADPPDLP